MSHSCLPLPGCLCESVQKRVPTLTRSMTQRQRIELLEDYLLDSAILQGDLTEERLSRMVALVPLQDEWDNLTGWEQLRQGRTNESIRHAKAQLRPELAHEITRANWIIKRLTEEIDRMERDASKVSRAYTMETGT